DQALGVGRVGRGGERRDGRGQVGEAAALTEVVTAVDGVRHRAVDRQADHLVGVGADLEGGRRGARGGDDGVGGRPGQVGDQVGARAGGAEAGQADRDAEGVEVQRLAAGGGGGHRRQDDGLGDSLAADGGGQGDAGRARGGEG